MSICMKLISICVLGNDPLTLIERGSQVSELIDKACREISKMVLDSLNENFKMQIHLEALRKYMLLGQGDFIHYLLKIIELVKYLRM